LQRHLAGRCNLIPWTTDDTMTPAATVGQIVQRPDLLIEYGVALVWQGRWQGRQYRLGVRDGVHDLLLRPAVIALPRAQRLDQVRDMLRTGDLDVGQ